MAKARVDHKEITVILELTEDEAVLLKLITGAFVIGHGPRKHNDDIWNELSSIVSNHPRLQEKEKKFRRLVKDPKVKIDFMRYDGDE